MAAPLTNLLKGKPKHSSFTPEAANVFQKLKELFVTAPMLKLPDPTKQLIIEVEASEVSLGAVLSQVHGEPSRLHPCPFFSRKLSSAECNYDIGNRELLVVKAALEERCHWLEGARQPFVVYIDQRLNPCQARWVQFFTLSTSL